MNNDVLMDRTREAPIDAKDASAVGAAAERIYVERYRNQWEKQHHGMFAVVDVRSKKAFVGMRPAEALRTARREVPSGVFHLICIGSPAAFRVS